MRIRYHTLVLAFVLGFACFFVTGADPTLAQNQPANSESAQKKADGMPQRASDTESVRNTTRQAVSRKRTDATGAALETKEASTAQGAGLNSMFDKFWTRLANVWHYQVWTIGERPLTVHMIFVAVVILLLGIMATKKVIQWASSIWFYAHQHRIQSSQGGYHGRQRILHRFSGQSPKQYHGQAAGPGGTGRPQRRDPEA